MIKKIFAYGLFFLAVAKSYKFIEEKFLNDESYLLKIVKRKRTHQSNELVQASLSEASRLISEGDYESALEYYMYVYKVMGCDWDFLINSVQDETMKELLSLKKEELCSKIN
ncbi:hypothetical protein GVAV_000916 [Gurleya vavrai]